MDDRSSSRARSRPAVPTEGAGYTEPVVQIARRFYIGARFDLAGLPSGPERAAPLRLRGVADLRAQRVLARAPLRAGADRIGVQSVTVAFLQVEYSMGAHGAHPY